MKITKEQVDKHACEGGRAWFAENFPQGGEYSQIIQTLNAHKHYEWARWGASQAYDLFLLGKTTAEFIKAETSLTDAMVEELNSMELPTPNDASASDNGEDDAQIGSSGVRAQIGSSGDGAQI
ncbi:hypothetical protein ABRP57_09535, partial [Pectobacterium aroidearum]|uniref:hypothetical protein n=1 Tax=Pectobacterium aroidearum TaxID=1201031 RepID=UPI0032EBC446